MLFRKKGHEGVKGTVTEDYRGILVHDHEITYYKYGSAHQECLAHVQRYLKDSMENEPSLTRNRKMRALIREMIHYRNEHADDAHLDPKIVSDFEGKYQEILEKAKEEYILHEPSPYYRDGYNLYHRMQEYKTQHLLFLFQAGNLETFRTRPENFPWSQACDIFKGFRGYEYPVFLEIQRFGIGPGKTVQIGRASCRERV